MAASHATVRKTDDSSEVNNQRLNKIHKACIQSTPLKQNEFFVVAIHFNDKDISTAYLAKATTAPSIIMAPLAYQTGAARLDWAKVANRLISTLSLENVYLKPQKDLYLRPSSDVPSNVVVPNWYMISCTDTNVVVTEMREEPFWLDINSFVEIE